jgi:hypothetical protein
MGKKKLSNPRRLISVISFLIFQTVLFISGTLVIYSIVTLNFYLMAILGTISIAQNFASKN